jgi:hypothetical protein
MEKITDRVFLGINFEDLVQIISHLADELFVKISSGYRDYEGCCDESEMWQVKELRVAISLPEAIKYHRVGRVHVYTDTSDDQVTFVCNLAIMTAQDIADYNEEIRIMAERAEMEAAGIYLGDMHPDDIIDTADQIKEFRAKKANK